MPPEESSPRVITTNPAKAGFLCSVTNQKREFYKMDVANSFKFLSNMGDVRDNHKDIYNVGYESGVYTVFAKNVLLNDMRGVVNLVNLMACRDVFIKNARVLYAPCLEYVENIVLPQARYVDLFCLGMGNIYVPDANAVRISNPKFSGTIFCGNQTNIKSISPVAVRRFKDFAAIKNVIPRSYSR